MNELIWQAQAGDKEALSEIVNSNIGLVWNIVKRFNNRGYEIEDLFQLGCMGFVKAIQRFDTNFDTQLSTYAVPMIIGEIKRFLRDSGTIKVSRSLKELATKIRYMQEEEVNNGREELSINDISKKLKVPVEDIVTALDATSYVESLDKMIGDDEDVSIGERIVVENKEYNNLLNKMVVEKILGKLEDKERRVIIFRYYKEKTQTEIAEILGISQVQVSRLEKRAIEKMKQYV